MPKKDGKIILCFLPKVEKAKTLKPVTQQNTSSMIVESEKRVKLKTPDELLEVVREFVLGVYDEEATAAFNQNLSDISTLKDHRSKDASQFTKVRFVCSEPRAMISSITELSTCKYARTVQSPMLCKHPKRRDLCGTPLTAMPFQRITRIPRSRTLMSMIMDSEDQSNNYDSNQ
ncbi:Ubiquitin-associated (UBA)/TS-N domain-containing protein [Hibiscus syriacus]|uniref:Ubiquitin-associated (UBA)/TS-N domain-containing protein n=1 Tax=Hibiscus syriacus TaxID=106335 RepID=A0A6A2Y780_HIBSY|nr:Ubiquitin-associated (UBA)/TS-N domain-containing protein [Hibiscus syriacus]